MSPHHCSAHPHDHVHGPDCGHAVVRHDDHDDYLVGDHLHHCTPAGCVDHGAPATPEAGEASGFQSP